MLRSHEGSIAPVDGSMTTVPMWASPLTRVKSPATRRRPSGSARRALTCALKSKAWPVQSPVFTSKAARPREDFSAPFSPCLTPVKLPPTYMVDPTCAKA